MEPPIHPACFTRSAEARGLLDFVVSDRIAFRYMPGQAGPDHFESAVPFACDRLLTAAVPAFKGYKISAGISPGICRDHSGTTPVADAIFPPAAGS